MESFSFSSNHQNNRPGLLVGPFLIISGRHLGIFFGKKLFTEIGPAIYFEEIMPCDLELVKQ